MGHFLFYKRPKEEQLLHFFAIINIAHNTSKLKQINIRLWSRILTITTPIKVNGVVWFHVGEIRKFFQKIEEMVLFYGA
jgi:hypothetical protein